MFKTPGSRTTRKRFSSVTWATIIGNPLATILSLVTSIGTPGTDTAVPTEKAVRDAITAAASGTVTHTAGALTAGQLVYGNGGADIHVVAATDGQVPIGKTSDGTAAFHTLTAGTNITITNGANSITIASTATGFDLTPDFLLMGG